MKLFKSGFAIIFCSLLMACGGSSGGSSDNDDRLALNGSLATPDDGARALSGLLFAVEQGAGNADLGADTGSSDDPCNTSGDATIVAFTGNSATVDFDQCRNITSGEDCNCDVIDSDTSDITLDGRAQLVCNDGFNSCNDSRFEFGQNSTGLFVDVAQSEGDTTVVDATVTLLGRLDAVLSENAAGDETTSATFNLSGSVTDQLENRSADFLLSELMITSVDFANDQTSLAANGDYQITSSNNCLNGGANVSTSSAFVFDENDVLQTGGQLALSNESGERATVSVTGNDQLTIMTVDGQSQTYTIEEIEAFCQ